MAEKLSFDAYQKCAGETAVYPGRNTASGIAYAALGINGEAGEIAEAVKKTLRDHEGVFDGDRKVLLEKEIGDVLWYLAELATQLGSNLEDIALMNYLKLKDRQKRNAINGSGDNR